MNRELRLQDPGIHTPAGVPELDANGLAPTVAPKQSTFLVEFHAHISLTWNGNTNTRAVGHYPHCLHTSPAHSHTDSVPFLLSPSPALRSSAVEQRQTKQKRTLLQLINLRRRDPIFASSGLSQFTPTEATSSA